MPQRSLLDEIRKRGVLRIPVEFSPPPDEGFPPEFYIDPKTGEPFGIAPIVGKLMATDLGVRLECVDMPWPDHIPAVLSGTVDLLPKHTNTPQRALQVEFARGRLTAYRVTALVRSSDSSTNKDDLNREGRVISVWHGSSILDVARSHFPLATIKEFKYPWVEVEEEKADACLNDSITKIFMAKHPGLRFLRDENGRLVMFSREYVHPSVRLGEQRFLNWIENWLEYHRAQGTIGYWCDVWWESFMADQE